MNRRIHVVHYAYAVSEGGAANGIVNICNGLDPSRFKGSIITLTPPGGFEARLDRQRTDLHRMPMRPGKDLAQPFRLARLLRKLKPDILHTHAWGTLVEGFVAARLAGVARMIHGEHGTLELRPSRRWLQRLLWNRTDRLLSVSDSLRERMVQAIGCNPKKILVVPNGVDTERFRPRAECRERFRRELGAGNGDLVLGTLGRLHEIKGHAHLIRALTELPEEVKLWIVGDGELYDDHRKLIGTLGLESRVRLLGHRNDANEILSGMDILCQPSLNEGMSNTILEAMATHLPVVASATGGNLELVQDGETGRLVEVGQPASLARAILDLRDRPEERTRMGLAGYRKAIEAHSLAAMVRNYEGVYSSVFQADHRHA